MATSDTQSFYDDNQNIETASPEKQVTFFKKKYEELQVEFEEYQFSSRELENELETQLSHYERRIRELEAKNLNLTNENEILRKKIDETSIENQNQINTLHAKLEETTSIKEQLTTHIRELEQSNDDLERAKRHLDATLADFDAKLNQQIERNEILESEIGEKEQLQVVIQRLKDEAKDLRLELSIQQNVKNKKNLISSDIELANSESSDKKQNSSSLSSNVNNFKDYSTANSIISGNNLEEKSCNNSNHNTLQKSSNQIPLLSASSRISALNIVSDLLRKVGALESKLASCRGIIPISNSLKPSTNGKFPHNHSSASADDSPVKPSFKNINANA